MTTSTYVSQLDALAKKVGSFVQSLQNAEIQPSNDQYTTLKTLSLRLSNATTAIPLEIEALKKRRTESCEEGRKLIAQAQSYRSGLVTTAHLNNRSVFARNIRLFFGGPQDSAIDSDTIKARKRLTRERCERICSLNPDGLISWAVAFAPSLWTANLMSNNTFDCVAELIEPQVTMVWPSDIHDVLRALGDEEPLKGSQKYHGFLKPVQDGVINQRKRRRMDAVLLPPSKEKREMKYMYTNAPASNISKLPEPFRTAVQSSRLWQWERSQEPELETTGCWASLFPKDYTQDVSFTIWCGHDESYRLNDVFGVQLAISS